MEESYRKDHEAQRKYREARRALDELLKLETRRPVADRRAALVHAREVCDEHVEHIDQVWN